MERIVVSEWFRISKTNCDFEVNFNAKIDLLKAYEEMAAAVKALDFEDPYTALWLQDLNDSCEAGKIDYQSTLESETFVHFINDGNYYLLAFSDKDQEIRTYRLDRMKDVEELNEPRDGEDEFLALDLDTFTQRTFGMIGGDRKGVTLRFINPLLDTVIDRFGTKGVRYAKLDDNHFRAEVDVEISDQFFGWLLGFGKRAKIIAPQSVVDEFAAYLDKIREMY